MPGLKSEMPPLTSPARAAITAVHGYVPPDVLTNAELARMVDTTDAWITERTGIKERHILKGEGLGTSHMGAEAVRGLLAKTGHQAGRRRSADLRDHDAGFRASLHRQPDLRHGRHPQYRQLRRAGGLLGLHLCADHRARSSSPPAPTRRSSWSAPTRCRRSSTTPIAPPACCSATAPAAVLLEPNTDGYGIMDTMLRSDGSGMKHLHQKAGGSRMPPTAETVAKRLHYVHQEGAAVYKFAVAGMAEVTREIMARNNLRADMIDWVVPHQANRRIIETTAERMGLPMDKVMVTIHKYGNTTTATIPLCLWDYESKLQDRRPAAAGRVRRRLHLGRRLSDVGL